MPLAKIETCISLTRDDEYNLPKGVGLHHHSAPRAYYLNWNGPEAPIRPKSKRTIEVALTIDDHQFFAS
jgi:hypothetical protein